MWTYQTLDGRVLDLTQITDEERSYLGQCVAAYRASLPWHTFTSLAEGDGSPLVRAAGGRVTQEIWDHPVFQAAYDMEARLGIAQGYVAAAANDDPNSDPFADDWVPAVEAAGAKGVTLSGLHQAIARHDIIARAAKPGGSRLAVSKNSLDRWRPSLVRQAAGRQRATATVKTRTG